MFGQGEEGDGLIRLGMGRRGLTMMAGLLAASGLVVAVVYYLGQPRHKTVAPEVMRLHAALIGPT